ncbi:MAG TPA: MBOAT family O-acyltransferase [Kofleriaceae bacterium]|nr:MBOAT family O-acyltransferase [Kofleriaceae bacterium]
MQFNSYVFAAFFVAVLAVYNAPGLTWRGQKVWLLVASYAFYSAWDPVFIVLVWLSTFVDWTAAKWITAAPTRRRRRLLLIVSVVVNLGVLGYFKYGRFVLANVVALLHAVGVDYHPAAPDIVLPIGISFYTFHTLSYTLDIYLGRTKPWPSFLDFALYVAFFPALVAGPILRASQFLPQCVQPRRTTGRALAWGLALLVLGLFEKCALADVVFAPAADGVFGGSDAVRFVDAWTGTLAFAGQIFCDFAGYSTCAIGVALCLGFSLPDNFRSPYASVGFSAFWTRWHISLSSWLRDYLYIPLGGNRIGAARTYVNLMLTMLIGGLWHGASWTFVVWGGLHGAYLIGERALRRVLPSRTWGAFAHGAGGALTFLLVCLAWVFFRAPTFGRAFDVVRGLVGVAGAGAAHVLGFTDHAVVVVAIAGVLAASWALRERRIEHVVARTPLLVRSAALAAMIVAIVMMQGEDRAFIYFQF